MTFEEKNKVFTIFRYFWKALFFEFFSLVNVWFDKKKIQHWRSKKYLVNSFRMRFYELLKANTILINNIL